MTFVPDGGPTLDVCLGRTVEFVKRETGVRVAVLTNAYPCIPTINGECSGDLMTDDLDTVKLDIREETCEGRLLSCTQSLRLDVMLEGIKEFTVRWKGVLIIETMLVQDVNTSKGSLEIQLYFLKS